MDVVGSEREEKMTTVTARFTVSPEWFERRERHESDDLRLGDYKIDLVVKHLGVANLFEKLPSDIVRR